MKHGGATDDGVSENTGEWQELWNSLALREFMVKGLEVCPASGHAEFSDGSRGEIGGQIPEMSP